MPIERSWKGERKTKGEITKHALNINVGGEIKKTGEEKNISFVSSSRFHSSFLICRQPLISFCHFPPFLLSFVGSNPAAERKRSKEGKGKEKQAWEEEEEEVEAVAAGERSEVGS